MKNLLLKIHRYAALVAAPFVAWLLITGLVLAFKPVLAPETATVPLGAQAAQVAQTVAQLEKQGVEIQSIATDKGGNVFWATVDGRLWAHDVATGERLYTAGMSDSLFRLFKKLHKSVIPDAEFISWVLLALMIAGAALLMRPRLRASLLAWHNALGLVLLPVWLMLPLTGILMEAHFGAPDFAKTQQVPSIPAMVRQLDTVGELGNVRELMSIKGGRFLLVKMDTAEGVQTFQINEDGYPAATIGTYWAKELHEGTWAGKVSGWLNVLLAAGILFFVFSGVYSWLRRFLRDRRARAAAAGIAVDSGSVLIAYASQTGRAEQLAQATQKALADAGARAEVLPMSALTAAMMRTARLSLLIASTTGEGELPDAGKALLKQLSGEKLPDTPYTLLALGDRTYTHFCGGGEKLQAALQNAAAREILPMARADGTPDAAWQGWLKDVFAHLHLSLGNITAPAATADVPLRLILRKRYPLHDAAHSAREVYALEFEAVGETRDLEFRGGDLLMIAPPAGHSLAPRSYSAGSDSRYNANLRLTVALHRFRLDNGETATGACSQWLCHDLPEGSEVQAALRAHPSFRLPEDNVPVIMAATGSGIAPLIGFLPALEKRRRTAWLFFGNTGEKGDFLERERLQTALQNGVLTRLETVFDDQNCGYVQDLMRANGGELYRLIGEENARIFVCGRSSTIGQGVLQALRDIAAEQGQDGDKWIAELQRNGQLHMDLFG